MRITLLIITILTLISCSEQVEVFEIGKKIPEYTFKEVLNSDQKPFSVFNRDKPIIIEFWATWCSPCIPAMKKLEKIQEEYGDVIDIITVSTDSKQNLNRYIKNSKTNLKVAYDTTHLKTFNYQYIPQAILVDKNGIVKALITPEMLTDELVSDLSIGNDIQIANQFNNSDVVKNTLNKYHVGNDFQFQLTSENKDLKFKSEIKRDDEGSPISLEFNNVSIHRLFADIYELTSVARIYNRDILSSKTKFCFILEQKSDYRKNLMKHAKEILNKNLDITANLEEIKTDSIYVLRVIDKAKLPPKSKEPKKQVEFRGPYYSGKKVSSYNLTEYLENEAFQPVKDMTLLDYTFDIELNWSYEDPKTLNKELKKYGLQISRPEKPEKVKLLVLRKKK